MYIVKCIVKYTQSDDKLKIIGVMEKMGISTLRGTQNPDPRYSASSQAPVPELGRKI